MTTYEPLAKIASGGTAMVFLGRAAQGELVAIKRPHAHLADDDGFRASLLSEARIAARLRHPNVVALRDVVNEGERLDLVMEYVEGPSLSELIRGFAVEPFARSAAVAVRVVLDACAGLDEAHELRGEDGTLLGLVHRDVSPQNVLVDANGVGKLADFGLAKPLLVVERTTSEGALRGKLGYMAPEYIRGKAIDRRVDVFALGVVLWEAIAKKRLFRGENDADTLDRVQRLDPPKLRDVVSDLGDAADAIDTVVRRALAKDPAERFVRAKDFAIALESAASAHGLIASREEVVASFSSGVRASLLERRAKVAGAPIFEPESPTSITPTTRDVPAPFASVGSRARRFAIGGGVVACAALAVAFAINVGSSHRAPAKNPAHVAQSSRVIIFLAEDTSNAIADDLELDADPAQNKGVSRSRPSRDAKPGEKKPRPNPYAGH